MTDTHTEHPGAYWLRAAEDEHEPLEAIAAALCGLLATQVHDSTQDSPGAVGADALASAHEQLAGAQTERNDLENVLGEVLSVCSKSKGQLAEKVRAVVLGPPKAAAGSDETPSPIEEWLAFAAAQGLEVDPGRTNGSQIRTMLGIPNT